MGTRISCIFVFAAGVCLLAGCASHGEQVLLDGVMTGDVEAARREAGEVARQWRSEINAAIRMVDTLRIVRLTADTLVVARGADEEVFVRNK